MKALRSAATRNVGVYEQVHKHDQRYGRSSPRLQPLIEAAILSGKKRDASWNLSTILDFGCGKSDVVDQVAASFGMRSFRYDPAIREFSFLQIERADIVINTDVLEHIDETELDVILDDIALISEKAFFNIATVPAKKILPNGENAHATVRSEGWWRLRLKGHFDEVHSLPWRPDTATFVTWPVRRRDFFSAYRTSAVTIARTIAKRVLGRQVTDFLKSRVLS